MRILLVDDNPSDAKLVQALLKNASGGEFEIEWIDRVGAAVPRLRAGWADVLLLDLTLPDSDGLETVLTARAAAPSVPIVVLSGVSDAKIVTAAFRAGVHDYIFKDRVNVEALLRALRYAIERADLQESLQRIVAEMAALLAAIPDTVLRLSRGGTVEILSAPGRAATPPTSLDVLLPIEGATRIMARLGQVLASGEPGAVRYRTAPDGVEHVAHLARCAPDDAIIVVRKTRVGS